MIFKIIYRLLDKLNKQPKDEFWSKSDARFYGMLSQKEQEKQNKKFNDFLDREYKKEKNLTRLFDK